MTFFVSWRIMPSMLNPERIPTGKLRQAYGLNDQEIEDLHSALLSAGIFPDPLWRNAYKSFWFGPMEDYLTANRIGTLFKQSQLDFLRFPEVSIPCDDLFFIRKWREQIIVLFMSLVGILSSDRLKKGINHIIEEIYDDSDDIFRKELEELFGKIAEEDKNYALQIRTCENINQLFDFMDWKRRAIPHKCFAFLSTVFIDSVIVNKPAAILRLFQCGYPLKREVKGISNAIVKRITAAPIEPFQDTPAEQPAISSSKTIEVPMSLWKGKAPSAVAKAMKERGEHEFVIAYVLVNFCAVTKIETGVLLRGHSSRVLTDSAYTKYTTDCLKEAAAYSIISSENS